jgi:pimeloyl-ACP methyl ester carboxylesterase
VADWFWHATDEVIYRTGCLAAGALCLVGCGSTQYINPAFPLTMPDARAAIRAMEETPIAFDRPVVVMSGIHDPGVAGPSIVRALRRIAEVNAPIVGVSFLSTWTFDSCRNRVFRVLDRKLGENNQPFDGEVDVIAVSMGGMVARHCAVPRTTDGRRLRIRRLFTISSPHRGAKLAWLGFFDPRAHDMKAGSVFLNRLDTFQRKAPLEIIAYARLNDAIVGEGNAGPLGTNPWWLATPRGELSHLAAHRDPRLLADIFRRLRREPAFTGAEPVPLPGDDYVYTIQGSGHGRDKPANSGGSDAP